MMLIFSDAAATIHRPAILAMGHLACCTIGLSVYRA
jgi:hypothetical protein